MEQVVVLLSSYNGEKYIGKQLQSILQQDYSGHIHILIRDDGSRDRTKDIIEEYCRKCERTENRSMELHAGKNVGPGRSFMRLVNKSPVADYYFFSDQDDIWNQDKVRVAVDAISESIPQLYSCAYRVIDKDDVITQQKSFHTEGWRKPLRALFYSESIGCSMAMNRGMMKMIKSFRFDRCMMHDNLIMMIALLKAEVLYDDQPHLSYRIHGENSQGLSPRKKSPKTWLSEKMKIFLHGEDYDLSETADRILQSGVKKEYRDDMILLRDYKKSPVKKWKLLLHKDMNPDKHLRWRISVFCHVLLELY